MKEKFAAIKVVLERLQKEFDDPQVQKMLRYMLMALAGLQLLLQYGT